MEDKTKEDTDKIKQELTEEELNDVAAGRAIPSSDTKQNIASLCGKCSCHPDGAYKGDHEFVMTGNKDRYFGIIETYECECKYCGTTKSDWELSLNLK